AQSSQQTVISLPATLTLIPPSLISQSHTGHFFVFIRGPLKRKKGKVAATLAADCREDTIARREKSGFKIIAHLGQGAEGGAGEHVGGGASELAAEGVGKVAVTGEGEVQCQRGQVPGAAGQPLERGAEAQPGQVAVERHTGALPEDAGEVKGGRMHRAGDV